MALCRLIVCLALLALPAMADWKFVELWSDPLDGSQTRAATSTSDTGVTLHLYRNSGGRVYALFTLPPESGNFTNEGIVARITPQGFDSKDIEVRNTQSRIIEYGRISGSMLRDRLWHGQGEAPAFGTLHDLLEAPALTGAFQLADKTTFDAKWNMQDARLPIAQALSIKIGGVASGAEWEDAASQSLLAAMTACQFPKLDVFCVQKVTACSMNISENRSINAFETCVATPSFDR